MSSVTSVLILLSLAEVMIENTEDPDILEEVESEALAKVNSWLGENGYGELIELSDYAYGAGNKTMSALVYGGAFNRLIADEFLDVVRQQQWRAPERVQILIKDEVDEIFSVYDLLPSTYSGPPYNAI